MARRKPAPEPSLACAHCGHLADPSRGTANFCPACGASLRAGTARARRRAGRRGSDGVIADRYRLLELLGEGGMGRVYKAEHIRMGKTLALKLLREDFAREPAAAERFLAEARAVSRLSHPHTLAVFDFGEVGPQGGLYLAMEYVPGEDLAAALARSGPFSEARAREVGQQILGSLAEAHDAGVVHRDVKPANVMLMSTRAGEDFVKVLDFGIAALRDDSAGGAAAIVGTPAYLAPEQARGAALDGRADLYALGCVLYELVAGRPPFAAPSPMAVVSAHLSQAPPLLASVAPGVSRAFADVVHRALQKRPEDRFPSADAMREALLALTGRPRPAARALEGDLGLASREDFDALGKQVRALRAGRVAPLALAGALAALAAGTALAWRWDAAYALLAARAPRLAAALPGALRPASRFDGREHEPNDRPEQANPLPLPPGPDGAAARGAAELLGRIGERRGRDAGDVDVFRVEVPEAGPRTALVAEWAGAAPGAGLPGLDVALTLHRAPDGAAGGAAPLVATADRAGPGGGERLVAAVSRGTYYLAVRERHAPGAPPVERPEDDYRLVVRLTEAAPGEELEPDDPPAPGAAEAEWAALAARNPLRAGAPLRGETSTDDPDVLAAGLEGAPPPALVVLVPDPGVALVARRATRGGAAVLPAGDDPLAEDLSAPGGAPLLVSLAPARAGSRRAGPARGLGPRGRGRVHGPRARRGRRLGRGGPLARARARRGFSRRGGAGARGRLRGGDPGRGRARRGPARGRTHRRGGGRRGRPGGHRGVRPCRQAARRGALRGGRREGPLPGRVRAADRGSGTARRGGGAQGHRARATLRRGGGLAEGGGVPRARARAGSGARRGGPRPRRARGRGAPPRSARG
ncbi:protein kinase domain-containing protein, partial [Anaeromyxobacter terrae]|uniref:protein kinase domain-containing protein n=1 Tax=Anaeromyxobacter terrae TaxID=2925406 RepID=UPI001F59B841